MKVTTYLEMGAAGCAETVAEVSGEVITINGVLCDLSAIGEGDLGVPSGDHPFAMASDEPIPATRTNGVLQVAIRWVFDPATADHDQGKTHPVFDIDSGPVPDPVKRLPIEQSEELE